MNKYELMVVYESGLKEDEVKKNISALKDKLQALKGSLISEDYWGLKDLAYEIKKNVKAYYVVLKAEMETDSTDQLSNWISGQEGVLRSLLTKTN